MSKLFVSLCITLLSLAALVAGCSDDKATTPNDNPNTPAVQLSSYAELVAQIAPPEFSGVALAPGKALADDTGYGFWATGDYPILGKVFAENEPMSLYRNIGELDGMIGMINVALAHPNDVFDTTVEDQQYSGTTSVTELESPIAIPADCQAALGTTAVDLDYLVSLNFDEQEGMVNKAAFSKDSTYERVLTYFRMTRVENQLTVTESNLVLSYRNLETDSLEIRAAFCKDQGDGTKAMWVYHITTIGDSEFAYRMSWYADDFGDTSAVACVVGGGDKDVEFALRYRQYRPADLAEPNPDDPYGNLTRTFGPNYSDLGAELAAGYATLTDPDLIFKLADFPTALVEDPME